MPTNGDKRKRVNLYRGSGAKTDWGTAKLDWQAEAYATSVRAGIWPLDEPKTIVQADLTMQVADLVMLIGNVDIQVGDMVIESPSRYAPGQGSDSQDILAYRVESVRPADSGLGRDLLVYLTERRIDNRILVPNG